MVGFSSAELRIAAGLVEELRPLTQDRRLLLARNDRHYRTMAVVSRIFVVAEEDAADSPTQGLAWLDVADALIELQIFSTDPAARAMTDDLRAGSLVKRSTMLSRTGETAAARAALEIVEMLEPADPLLEAEYLEAIALLHSLQQDLPGALRALAAARTLYRALADLHLEGRALVKVSFAHAEARDYEPAIDYLVEASRLIDPVRDRRLPMILLFNLARYLADAGRGAEALRVLTEARGLFGRRAKRTDQLRLRWLEGSLLMQAGRVEDALESYAAALDGFNELGQVPEVAEIALEAAAAFRSTGRARELVPLLAVAIDFMRGQGLRTEALAAWLELRDAAAQEAVTSALLAAARVALVHP